MKLLELPESYRRSEDAKKIEEEIEASTANATLSFDEISVSRNEYGSLD